MEASDKSKLKTWQRLIKFKLIQRNSLNSLTLKQFNSTLIEFTFIIEGTSEKLHKSLKACFITLSVVSSYNLHFLQ